jgi:hypothetical protein
VERQTPEPGPIRRMLTELNFPIVGRDDHQAVEDEFVAALEPQMGLLGASGGTGEREAHIVIRQMIARALGDLMASMHLARHGYLSNSYNEVRGAYESLELAELVIALPDEAARWVNSEEPHRDFSPGAVRKRLGRPSFDEVYSHYSELAHPRFQSSRFNTFGRREEGKERLQILVTVGPTKVDEFPDFWFLVMAITVTVGKLLLSTAGLVAMGEVGKAAWDEAALETTAALKRMGIGIEEGLKRFGFDDVDGFASHFDSAKQIIDDANRRFPDDEGTSG